ncbi:MAG: SPOR domain-containing protein [Wenzhouxiangella sp.]
MDKVLKQRLIGATILIALAVIFIPMLFDERPDREGVRDTAIELPPAPVDRREVRRLPLDPDVVREAPPPPPEPVVAEREEREITLLEPEFLDEQPFVLIPEPTPEVLDDVAEPEPEAPALAEAVRETSSPTPTPAPAQPAAPASGSASWMVQVASFSSADTANRVSEQLAGLGHAAAVDVIVRGDSRLYRVRTGPYATRADGDRARSQIATTVRGVDPVVMSAPAGLSAPPAARAAAGDYSVQVGSFTARANADRLSEQLRGAGFDAFIHPDESGARPIWRVRVGALASRDEATELRRRLLDQAGLEGLIVSDP